MSTSPATAFAAVFGVAPEAAGNAPGRVNVLGDHTDYNGGFVLPTAIPQSTTVEAGRSATFHEVYSSNLARRIAFGLDTWEPLPDFARYLGGCLRVLQAEGFAIPPLRFAVQSTVPLGAGLSSSAALEVATLRAVARLLGLALDPLRIALLAQRAEMEYAGVQCGIMDQMACSLGEQGSLLLIDTSTLEYRRAPLPAGSELVVVNSGVPRTLSGSAYNARRRECEQAARYLNVTSLRAVKHISDLNGLPSTLMRRVRHVVSENQRVLDAVAAGARQFGRLMNFSHMSLRDDYEVSVPQVDDLVAFLQALPTVFGARMTGAGFGGACVALVEEGTALEVTASVEAMRGFAGSILVAGRNPYPQKRAAAASHSDPAA